MVGNRSINYWVTAIGAQASDMGSWLFFGFPVAVYQKGLFELWTAIGLVCFMYLNWQYIAPRLRQKTGTLNSLTLTSFFSHSFHDAHGYIQITSAFICILFFTFYIASGLVGLGRIFESAFGTSYHQGIIIGLLVTGCYTLLGGFGAVAWSNLFQGIFLLCMIMLVPVYAYSVLPHGLTSITQAAATKLVSLQLIQSPYDLFQAFLLAISWGLGYFGQPHILVYFMSIDDQKNITYAKYVGIAWQILVLAAATAIGLIGLAFFQHDPQPLELLFISMTQALFHPLIVGFVLCAIFAAVLTTMNSHILIAGSVIATDICGHIKKDISSITSVTITRISSLCISIIALTIAWHNNSSIYNLVNYAWSGLGAAFGPLVIVALYGRNISYQAALWGLITGASVSAAWPYCNTTIFPLIPGFFANFLILAFIQYVLKKQNLS
jgi:sodium/proline symporter